MSYPLLEHYDIKLLLALKEALSGRKDFFRWLATNGYPQLAAFSNAVRADEEAMMWLFKNNYPQFAILSNAIDGDEKAKDWIRQACAPVNFMFALACRDDITAIRWLQQRDLGIFLLMAQEVHKVLEMQAAENAGPYVMHFGGNYRVAEEMTQWLKNRNQ